MLILSELSLRPQPSPNFRVQPRMAWTTGVAFGLALLLGAGLAAQMSAAHRELQGRDRTVHALDRLTWGIEPGQVEAVEKLGLKTWIDDQLHPGHVAENPELKAALAGLDSLDMTPAETLAAYPPPGAIRQMANGRLPLPADPKLRAVVEWEIARLNAKKEDKDQPRLKLADDASGADAPPLATILTPEQLHSLQTGPPRDRVAALESLPAPTRNLVLASLPLPLARQVEPWVPLSQAHQLAYNNNPQQVTALDLTGAKVLRAVYSNRQLEDVLTDFWFNHFNVNLRKGDERELLASYERDAIRPHVLGKFRDLLLATAQSPAMLFYLDNWQSRAGNLNENYGREIMELHTIGLHYTQADVIAAARCFTGWTILQPQRQARFLYNDRMHDKGEKIVLGMKISSGGGMDDGLKLIDLLSRSPLTARHISFELAQRFVSDDPPPALVNRMAKKFESSDGDLRQVMETMINSPEFWQSDAYRSKMKSPFELAVSAVRALGADVSNPLFLSQQITQMGEPLYAHEAPTGYSNRGADWASSSGLVARMNLALRLAANQAPGVQVDVDSFAPTGDPAQIEAGLEQVLLQGQASPPTHAAMDKVLAQTPAPAPVRLAGLLLGSPDFQRR